MKLEQHFKEQESKLTLEALIKSFLAGLTVGGPVGFIIALVTWFTEAKGLWLSIGAIIGVTAIATAIFYLLRFRMRPIDKARRIDRLGLDERLITMIEYENDDSYMAQVQRRDAKQRLSMIKKSDIRLCIARSLVVFSVVAFVMASGMTTVTALADAGVIWGGDDFIDAITPEEPEINLSVTYEAEEGGYIDGEAEQLVLQGKDAEPVLAVADDGYVFIEWSDGSTDPYRHDLQVMEEIELFAIFEWDEEAEDGEEEGDQGEGEGDMSAPAEDQGQQEGEGEESQPSDEDGEPGEEDSEPQENDKYGAANQVIDGDTYYREILSEYQDKLKDYLEANRENLTEEEIAIIESYIKNV